MATLVANAPPVRAKGASQIRVNPRPLALAQRYSPSGLAITPRL